MTGTTVSNVNANMNLGVGLVLVIYFQSIFSETLPPDFSVFRKPSGQNWSALTLDRGRGQIIAGGRDTLVRLRMTDLTLIEAADWPAAEEGLHQCLLKGQSRDLCANHVTVLHVRDRHALVCGTNAFSPSCTWRRVDKLSTIERRGSGLGVSPYSPLYPAESLLTPEGSLFAATSADFSGLDVAVWGSPAGGVAVRTPQYDAHWLDAARPAAILHSAQFVYVVLTESASSQCGLREPVITVARLCASDVARPARRRHWRSFRTTRLLCPLPNEEKSSTMLRHATTATLTGRFLYVAARAGSLTGSAVCQYRLSDIDSALEGPHLRRSEDGSWEPRNTTSSQCTGDQPETFHRMQKHVVTSQPPFVVDSHHTWSHVSVAEVPLKEDGGTVAVMVALSADGELKKVRLSKNSKPCNLDSVNIFQELKLNETTVRSFMLDTDSQSLFIGTDAEIVRHPVARCHRHRSATACAASGDPQCGWDGRQCRTRPSSSRGWIQADVTRCPGAAVPAPLWSAWSDWSACPRRDSVPLSCQCRRRLCSVAGQCSGDEVQVRACSVAGGWSAWSAWSPCSATCGLAVRSRRRVCSNPAPARGGPDCVGPSSQEQLCAISACAPPASAPVAGGWSPWSAWSSCDDSRCGALTLRSRQRRCDSPAPAAGGASCPGCARQLQPCPARPCAQHRRTSDWTDWVALNVTAAFSPTNARILTDRGVATIQRRFQYTCDARAQHVSLVSRELETQRRRCDPQTGGCRLLDSRPGAGWGEWSDWSRCSRPCGGGVSSRSRHCHGGGPDCPGAGREEKECHTHACDVAWTCWGGWSQCTCGGARRRRRRCRTVLAEPAAGCAGSAEEAVACGEDACSGWGGWGGWSPCSAEFQFRRRQCDTVANCSGPAQQRRPCVTTLPHVQRRAAVTADDWLPLAGAALGSFCVGAVIAGLLTCRIFNCSRDESSVGTAPASVPSSPHYISGTAPEFFPTPVQKRHRRRPSTLSLNSLQPLTPTTTTTRLSSPAGSPLSADYPALHVLPRTPRSPVYSIPQPTLASPHHTGLPSSPTSDAFPLGIPLTPNSPALGIPPPPPRSPAQYDFPPSPLAQSAQLFNFKFPSSPVTKPRHPPRLHLPGPPAATDSSTLLPPFEQTDNFSAGWSVAVAGPLGGASGAAEGGVAARRARAGSSESASSVSTPTGLDTIAEERSEYGDDR